MKKFINKINQSFLKWDYRQQELFLKCPNLAMERNRDIISFDQSSNLYNPIRSVKAEVLAAEIKLEERLKIQWAQEDKNGHTFIYSRDLDGKIKRTLNVKEQSI